jgi:hypothetical protein
MRLLALASLALACALSPATPASASPCAPAGDVNLYQGCLSSHVNWGKRYPDRTIGTAAGSHRLSVTASTALAGAIASVRLDGRELVASGGHGSALQYAFHAHGLGECWNPTEAGSDRDDVGGGPQFHGPSTSRLFSFSGGARWLATLSRLAMYVAPGSRSSWNGCTPSYPAGFPFENGLSPYLLSKNVSVAAGAGGAALVRFDTTLQVLAPEQSSKFDSLLIAYLTPRLDHYWEYDTASGALTPATLAGHTSLGPIVAATADGREAVGMWSAPAVGSFALTYYLGYQPGTTAYPFQSHTVQTTWWGRDLRPGRYRYRSAYAVGTLREVARTLVTLAR